MNDEFLGQFHLEPDDGYSAPVVLERSAVTRSRVGLVRNRVMATRRGPRRTVRSARALWGQFSAGWEFEISDDFIPLKFLMEAFADIGSGTSLLNGMEWTFGKPAGLAGHRTFSAYAVSADGRSYRLHRGVAQELALTVEPNRIVGAQTRFAFSRLEEVAADDPTIEAAPTEWASGLTASVEWDAVELPVFALALNFVRPLAPAGVNYSGEFTGALGSPVPDITGRLACRVDPGDDDIFLGEVTRSLTLRIEVGGNTILMEFPAVVFESLNRGIVSAGSVEHAVQFLATAEGSSPLATISLLEP